MADNAGKTAEVIKKAIDKIKSEKAVEQILDSLEKVSCALEKTSIKVQSEEAVQKVADNTVKAAEALAKTAAKIQTAGGKEKITNNAAAVINTALKMMDRMTCAAKLDKVADKILDSAGQITVRVEKAGANKLREKAAEVADKVIAKAGIERLSENEIQATGNKTVATVDPAKLAARAEKVNQKAKEMEQKLAANQIQTTRLLQKKVTVEIPGRSTGEIQANLPAAAMDNVAAKGINKVEVKTEVAAFNITPQTFGEKAGGKEITLAAQKASAAEIPPRAIASTIHQDWIYQVLLINMIHPSPQFNLFVFIPSFSVFSCLSRFNAICLIILKFSAL